MGFCAACGDRTPLIQAPTPPSPHKGQWIGYNVTEPQELSVVSTQNHGRISMGFQEMNRVLGGGLVPGSLVLFAGEPGVGKSTLLLQAAGFVANQSAKVLYISGEESAHQIKLRSDRLGLSGQGLYLLAETDIERIIQHLDHQRPTLAIIDSVQTLYSQQASSGPGSVAQVRQCALQVGHWAKARETPVLLAGHVTKDGTVAGPRVLEHMVDVILYLEGENLGSHRLLRSVKNRFGSTNEIAMFQMRSTGLEEGLDPSKALLAERNEEAIGSAIVPVLEGSRPLMAEVQALTSPSSLPAARRTANSMDYNRMIMIAAVLSRRAHLGLFNQDIIVNVPGGIKVTEPGADLALALAIASSLKNFPLHPSLAVIGEVGLSGELRSVPQMEARLAEIARLGFSTCLLPASTQGKIANRGNLALLHAPTVTKAIRLALDITGGNRSQSYGSLLTEIGPEKE